MHLFLISFSRVNSDAPPLPHSRGIKVCSFEFLIRTFFWSSNNPGCWGTGKNFREEETFLGEGSDGTSPIEIRSMSVGQVSGRESSSSISLLTTYRYDLGRARLFRTSGLEQTFTHLVSLSLSHLGLNGDRRTRFSPSETRKREDRGVWRISNCG